MEAVPAPKKRSRALPHGVTPQIRRAFQHDLVDWYRRHARALPWRTPPGSAARPDPYAVVVSELMLQQTQVASVRPYFERWMRRFPDWAALARAREQSVLRSWEGLGYYARARNLHRLAKEVTIKHKGELPTSVEALRSLPGIGPYTAGAVASIAFGRHAALVDGNVIRILVRVLDCHDDVALPRTQQKFWEAAEALLPAPSRGKENACGDFNQALMDLGAGICKPGQPLCLLCPLQKVCRAPDPAALPVKRRVATEQLVERVALIADKTGARWWCEQIPANARRWPKFWRFPLWDENRMEALEGLPPAEAIYRARYTVTRFRVELEGRRARWKKSRLQKSPPVGEWLTLAQMRRRPFAAPYRRLIEKQLAPTGRASIRSLQSQSA